jgi:probable rRNA maturation factor
MPGGGVPMASRPIDLQVFPAFRALVSRQWLRKVATLALRTADPSGARGVSVVIADDLTLQELNLTYRGYDEVTDVLSFSPEHSADDAIPEVHRPSAEDPAFPAIQEEDEGFGEVVISYPQAARQGLEHEQSLEQELALLLVHGVLHLFGHDHVEAEEEATMREMEQRTLARVFPR